MTRLNEYRRGAYALAAAIMMMAGGSATADVIYVDGTAPSGGDGSSWGEAYRHLRDAIDHTAPGDSIRVATGIYRPDESIFFPNGSDNRFVSFDISGLVVTGGYAGLGGSDPDVRDPDLYPTILNGDLEEDDETPYLNRSDNSFTVVHSAGLPSTLNGFTVEGGTSELGTDPNGAGMEIDGGSVSVLSCRFLWNDGNWGGGVYAENASLLIEDCEFRNNRGDPHGAGVRIVACTSVVIENTEFHDNRGDVGCGISSDQMAGQTIMIEGCRFIGNVALGGGAGIFAFDADIELTDCEFRANASANGGSAMHSGGNTCVATNCIIAENFDSVQGSFATGADLTMINCVCSRNSHGAVYAANGFLGINCSFSRNDYRVLGAENNGSVHSFSNCIFWENESLFSTGIGPGLIVHVDYSCVQGGWPGTGNIDDDPLFVQSGTDDLRLSDGSPCLNAGSNAAVPPGIDTDLAVAPRIQDGIVDMGAYEGAFEAMAEAASASDLDQGDVRIVSLDGIGFDPLHQTTMIIANQAGEDDASFTATVVDGAPGPVPGGFTVNGRTIQVQTDGMIDGEFKLSVFMPFTSEDLDGALPFDLDPTSLADNGNWSVATSRNVQISPGHEFVIGDRIEETGPGPFGSTGDIGDYGVYWDPEAGEGVMWANVDHNGTLSFGESLCRADVQQPPDGMVDFNDILFLLSFWGLGSGPADVDQDHVVDLNDLIDLLGAWGGCP